MLETTGTQGGTCSGIVAPISFIDRTAEVLTSTPDRFNPRVLQLDLSAIERGESGGGVVPWVSDDPVLARVAEWGGSALAVALLVEEARSASPGQAEPVPLVLSVGNAVRRGLPTAARLSVASRGAQSGLFSEGQVGGDCALRIAPLADAIVLRGRTTLAGAVLEIDADARVRLHRMEELATLKTSETRLALQRRFGDVAALCIGPAGERGVPFATLVSGLEHASHVGRGGLGAVFGRLGLKALVFSGDISADAGRLEQGHASIAAAIVKSPRLRARGEGGTHELWSAFQSRGDLRGKNYSESLSGEDAARLWTESREGAGEPRGCKGCPTPCGWIFDREDRKAKARPRFGAAWALGPNLGFDRLDPALDLFELCDEFGIDAKETGAVLALMMRARELGRLQSGPAWGTVDDIEQAIAALVAAPERADSGALGALALARELGLEDEVFAVKNQSVRPDRDLASLLGQCVSSNGTDPMRSFPFSTGDGLDRAQIAKLLDGIDLPPGTEIGTDPRGVGRLVWWHENFVAAVDASGFCSFSAGGLVADGVVALDRLADWIAPPSTGKSATAETMLDLGASVVWLRRELASMWGGDDGGDQPTWTHEQLKPAGVLDEYRSARGLDSDGRPREAARERLAKGELYAFGKAELARLDAHSSAELPPIKPVSMATNSRPGTVIVRGLGSLAERLKGEVELALKLPAPLNRVLLALTHTHPQLDSWLFLNGRALPAVYRSGSRLAFDDPVQSGDVLELVLAVSGG